MKKPANLTEISYSAEDELAARKLYVENYDTLLNIARQRRYRSRMSDTMSTSDILHESYLKLQGQNNWLSPNHFKHAASLAMRQVIVDHARRRLATKRGSGMSDTPLEMVEASLVEFVETPEQIIEISNLLRHLEAHNARWLRVVDARYFCGFTEAETAELLDLSVRTVRRDWVAAKAWLYAHLNPTHTTR